MWTPLFVIVWTILNIHSARGLSCYHCNNITDTRTCKQTVDCPDGKRCLYSNVGGNRILGCADDLSCPTSVAILGRRDGSESNSFCCDQDLCNGGQAELATTTTQTPEVCMDLNAAFCSTTSVQSSICSDPDLSVNWCRKTCGRCRK
ncbi:lymphocyte antigen 6D-like [Saccostrea cucullata]|uniref:lymphocyte antigen 6D-like n=1 Tax=Saccostrea cuccullata TaxID=36930 RepID=UPI002ED6630E